METNQAPVVKPIRARPGRALSSFLFFAIGLTAGIYQASELTMAQARSSVQAKRDIEEVNHSLAS